jgi:mRNA-degrading endonuclease RelE of RelBE toxin-antitoxin system
MSYAIFFKDAAKKELYSLPITCLKRFCLLLKRLLKILVQPALKN